MAAVAFCLLNLALSKLRFDFNLRNADAALFGNDRFALLGTGAIGAVRLVEGSRLALEELIEDEMREQPQEKSARA